MTEACPFLRVSGKLENRHNGGMRGRKPKSTILHRLEGTRPSEPRKAEPQAAGSLGEPPLHLTAAQAVLWNYYAAAAPAGVLRAVDAAVFQTFILAVDGMNQAAAALARDGAVIYGDDGPLEHPASRMLARLAAVVVKAGSECGFSPASRPRISVEATEAANPFDAFARPLKIDPARAN